jgi:hypothetical protein
MVHVHLHLIKTGGHHRKSQQPIVPNHTTPLRLERDCKQEPPGTYVLCFGALADQVLM